MFGLYLFNFYFVVYFYATEIYALTSKSIRTLTVKPIIAFDFRMLISFDFAKLQLKFVIPNFCMSFLQKKRKPTKILGLKEVRQNLT